MKSLILVLLSGIFLNGSGQSVDTFKIEDSKSPVFERFAFSPGERLAFRVHYGMITAGEAIITVDEKAINGKDCYRIDVAGNSTGFFDYVIRIRDNWGTYLNTETLLPERFYMNIEEGRYRRYEVNDFKRQEDSVWVTRFDRETRKPSKFFKNHIPENTQDMISGSYILRNIDYSKMKVGDIIAINGYFDKELYDFKIKYLGKETVKTDFGKVKAIKLLPLMPENSLFDGENAIALWLSDDEHKVPLKIKAKMFVGSVEIDIKSIELANNKQVSFY